MNSNVIDGKILHGIYSMARIGDFYCGGLYRVNVYSGEGNIPHFHVINTQNNKETCIRIDCAAYFLHDYKTYVLNAHEKKQLMNFLTSESPYEEDYGKTYYDLIWEEWNRNNREYRISKPKSIPNYRNL